MSALVWAVIIIAALVVVLCAYCFTDAQGYKRGYAAGRHDERRAARTALDQIQRKAMDQTLRAQRDIDYLYERARWQISQQRRALAGPSEDDHQ